MGHVSVVKLKEDRRCEVMRSGCMFVVCIAAANLKARIVTGRKQGVNRAVSFLSQEEKKYK